MILKENDVQVGFQRKEKKTGEKPYFSVKFINIYTCVGGGWTFM